MEIHLRQLALQFTDPFDFIERVHQEHPNFLHHNNTAIRELAQVWYKSRIRKRKAAGKWQSNSVESLKKALAIHNQEESK